ncbi:DUF305 domain-containing protein [Streptomyces olindensis]|uniref:DUF305 domain-containing protein n=1 Tax=Streptomyces olindensis TaxID=358823 RepID=UPI0033C0E1AD
MLLGRLDAWGLPKSSQEPPMTWMGHGPAHKSLGLMTEHHRGGAKMSEAAAVTARAEQVPRSARSMLTGHQPELDLMAAMLTALGATVRRL